MIDRGRILNDQVANRQGAAVDGDRRPAGDRAAVLVVGLETDRLAFEPRPALCLSRLSEALSVLADTPAAAIVVDLDLPDSTGISTVQRLLQPADGAPIIAVIDPDAEPGMAHQTLESGGAAYLPRDSATPDVLRSLVDSVIVHSTRTEEMRRMSARLSVAVDGGGDGLWDWDLRTGRVYFSKRCNEILGIHEGDSDGHLEWWFQRVHPEDLKFLRSRLDAHIDGARPAFDCEHRIVNGFGDPRWVLARGRAVRDLDGRVKRIAGFLTDITDRHRAEDQAIQLSLHDDLTGLPNRGLFVDRVGRALAMLNREDGNHLAVLFVDLDHFKELNDSHGHRVGDMALQETARRLDSVLRPGDTVARLGGDEFGVLVTNVGEADMVVHVAERILDLVSKPITVGRNQFVVNASVGIALSTTGYKDAHQIIHDADLAMYRAKSLGRSQCQICDEAMHRDALLRLKLEGELRQAIDTDGFHVYYQPIVDLARGVAAGVEGLVRWHRADGTVMTPAEFIRTAETSCLIVPLGWWVLQEACSQVAHWRRSIGGQEDLWLSVNLSPVLLMRDETADRLVEIVETAGLPPSAVTLEFPEMVLVDHGERVLQALSRMKDRGFRLAVDDFGSDLASLKQLDRKVFDVLKLDPSMTGRLVESGDRLPSSLIGLAEQLDIEVIAEGVETREQFHALRTLGCSLAQGFWFGEALSVVDIERVFIDAPEGWIDTAP